VTESGSSRTSGFFERAGLITVSVLVFFLLAEGITRIVDAIVNDVPVFGADKDGVLYSEHPFLYLAPRPNARYDKFVINSRGFRGREFEIPKPPGTFRILTLGGSAAWDTDVSGTDATWAAQLEDRLNERRPPGVQRFEVVNGGVPGYNSAESFMNFVWRGLPIDPDAVIVYQGYNDFKPNRFPDFKPDYSHFRIRDHSTMRALSRKFRFLHHMRRWLVRLKFNDQQAYDEVTEPGIRAFQDNLRRIVVLARDRGIQPLLSTYAMSVSAENREQHPEKFSGLERYLVTLTFEGVLDAHRRYNQAVRELARELSVPLADIDAAVPRDFEHFNDHCHFEDPGSRRAAEAFAEVVLTAFDLGGEAAAGATAADPPAVGAPAVDAP